MSAIKASRDAGGLQEDSTSDRAPAGAEGAGTRDQAGLAFSRTLGVATDSLLQTIGDSVDTAGGSSLSFGPRETSSIKSAVPKFNGSGVEFPFWKRHFEGFPLPDDCMQAFTSAIDTPVDDPSVTFRFLQDQGFSEASVKPSRIAWTCLTESITDRELLSRVFDTNSPSAGWRMLCDWFLPKPLSEKSKGKRQFNELVMEKKEEPMRILARVDKIVGVSGSPGSICTCGGCEPKDRRSAHRRLRIRTTYDVV